MYKYLILLFCCFFFKTNNSFAYKKFEDNVRISSELSLPILMYVPQDYRDVNLGTYPIQFYVHGGGWNGNDDPNYIPPATISDDARFLCDALGIIYVGLAYSVKDNGATFAQAINELEQCVTWFLDNKVNEFKANANKIGFAGSSAGSTLSSIMAQKYDNCLLYIGNDGMYDITAVADGSNDDSNFPSEQSREDYGLDTNSKMRDASAIFNLRTPKPPATLLLHGTCDYLCDYRQSERFAEAIRNQGGTCTVVLNDGINHRTLDSRFPTSFKINIIAMANHYINEFGIGGGNNKLNIIEQELDDFLINKYTFRPFPNLESVYGDWREDESDYKFRDNGTAYQIDDKGDRYDYRFEIDGDKLVLTPRLDNPETETRELYMRKNWRLYELITDQTIRHRCRRNDFEKLTNLSVIDHELKNAYLHPNPTTKNLFFSNIPNDVSYEIYTLNGQKIKSGKITKNSIDVSSLKSSVYFIKLNSGTYLKFIKTN